MIASFRMDPSAARTFTINWASWPFPPGTRIASAVWSIPPQFEVLDQSVAGMKTNVKVRFKLPVSVPRDFEFACLMVTNESVRSPNVPAQDTRRIGVTVIPR